MCATSVPPILLDLHECFSRTKAPSWQWSFIQILKHALLNAVILVQEMTEKKIRKLLRERFGQDMHDRKAFIREQVSKLIAVLH